MKNTLKSILVLMKCEYPEMFPLFCYLTIAMPISSWLFIVHAILSLHVQMVGESIVYATFSSLKNLFLRNLVA